MVLADILLELQATQTGLRTDSVAAGQLGGVTARLRDGWGGGSIKNIAFSPLISWYSLLHFCLIIKCFSISDYDILFYSR